MAFGSFFKKFFAPQPEATPPTDAPDPSSDAAEALAQPKDDLEHGFFTRLRHGLAKTAERFTQRLSRVLTGATKLDDKTLDDIEEILHTSDLGSALSCKLMDEIRLAYQRLEIQTRADVLPYMQRYLIERLPPKSPEPIVAAQGVPTVVLVVGVNGTGKTTSIAKLARLFRDAGKQVLLAAGDTFRAAAIDQLETWAERVGVDLIKHRAGSDPGAVVHDACEAATARGVDFLLIDTAGRLHNKQHLMRELEKIRRVAGRKIPGAPHEVLLVLDATTGQNALTQAKVFTDQIGVTGLMLTKLDGTAKGGVVIAIWNEIQIPVKYIGTGETPYDIAPFDPEAFIRQMFGNKNEKEDENEPT